MRWCSLLGALPPRFLCSLALLASLRDRKKLRATPGGSHARCCDAGRLGIACQQ
ncbi:MAG: hypothetical protein P8I91_05310 [Phycisphaerales bacterium]|nr:hypothetical protein [Phycisphaerales bacterium]